MRRRKSTATSNTLAIGDAHELALRVLDLVVQAAQHAAREREWLSCTNSASMPAAASAWRL
jgi:hypothetical protein